MPTLARFAIAFAFLSTACSGELYIVDGQDTGDFGAADRDGGGDPIDDPSDTVTTDTDYTGDGTPVLGDVITGAGDTDTCPECCGFGGVCPSGQECVVGV